MHRRDGFNVQELLVVLVIIGLFIVLVLPARRPQYQLSRRSACQNNLKQIGLACAQYSADFADRIPCGQSSVFQNVALMSSQLGAVHVLICPSGTKKSATRFDDQRATDV